MDHNKEENVEKKERRGRLLSVKKISHIERRRIKKNKAQYKIELNELENEDLPKKEYSDKKRDLILKYGIPRTNNGKKKSKRNKRR